MDNKPVKVLMVVPNLRVSNGVATFAMNYYRNIDHDRFHIDFVTLSYRESPYIAEVEEKGSQVFVLPSLLKHPFKHKSACRKILTDGGYDIIHDNSLNKTIPLMKLAKKTVPVRILHSHNFKMGETKFKEAVNKLILPVLIRTANFLTACSSNAGTAMFGKREYKVIPNIIDTDAYLFDSSKRDEVRTRENAAGKKIIGSVGRLAFQKNPFFAVDIAEQLIKMRDDAEYWWIGSGPLDEQVRKYVAGKVLDGRIRLFGSRNDVKDLYQAMDMLLLPSRFEGFPLTGIEAQASGLPCAVSAQLPAEVNITGEVTFIPLTESPESWAEKISRILDGTADRSAMNRKCRESGFSIYGAGNTLSDYYSTCLASVRKG